MLVLPAEPCRRRLLDSPDGRACRRRKLRRTDRGGDVAGERGRHRRGAVGAELPTVRLLPGSCRFMPCSSCFPERNGRSFAAVIHGNERATDDGKRVSRLLRRAQRRTQRRVRAATSRTDLVRYRLAVAVPTPNRHRRHRTGFGGTTATPTGRTHGNPGPRLGDGMALIAAGGTLTVEESHGCRITALMSGGREPSGPAGIEPACHGRLPDRVCLSARVPAFRASAACGPAKTVRSGMQAAQRRGIHDMTAGPRTGRVRAAGTRRACQLT